MADEPRRRGRPPNTSSDQTAAAILDAARREFAAHGYAGTSNRAIAAAAQRWFGGDRSYPAHYEPGGADFLSPGLCEALLMHELLGEAFAPWWSAFEPAGEALAGWLQPARVSDRIDPQLVHLDGLNLSRAWCLQLLAEAVPAALAPRFVAAAQAHREAAWPHVSEGDFAATHWLVSFALLSLGD